MTNATTSKGDQVSGTNAEQAAWDELTRLTAGNPGRLWRWNIPADPERDSDLILAAGLKAVAAERDAALADLSLIQHPCALQPDSHDADWWRRTAAFWAGRDEQHEAERDAALAAIADAASLITAAPAIDTQFILDLGRTLAQTSAAK